MGLGIIKNSEIKNNKDSTKKSLLLQVEITTDDIKTIELFSQAGNDANPAKDCRVFFAEAAEGYLIGLGITDDIEPEVDPGEKQIYSTDSPATEKKAKIKLASNGDIEIDAYGGATINIKADGNIELNGNTDYIVSWTDLNTVIQIFVTALNALFATKLDGGGSAGTLTLDLSTAKVETVRIS